MKHLHDNLTHLTVEELNTALIRLGKDPFGVTRKGDLVAMLEDALKGNPLGPLFTVGPEGALQLRKLLREGEALTDALVSTLPVVEDSLHLLQGFGLSWHTRGHWELTPQAKLLMLMLSKEQLQLLREHDALYTAIHGCLNLYGMLEVGELLALIRAAGWPELPENDMVRAYMAVCPPSEVVFVAEGDDQTVYLCTDELDEPGWLYQALKHAEELPRADFSLKDYHRADILPGSPEIFQPLRAWLQDAGATDAQAEHLLYDLVFAYLNDPEAPLSMFTDSLLEYAHGKAALTPEEQRMLLTLLERLPRWTHRGHAIRDMRRAIAQRIAVGRDDYCPCGSGRKYGKCCGNFH